MSYQVNLNQNTSIYVNQSDGQNVIEPGNTNTKAADRASGSVQAATEADKGLMQAIDGGEEIVKASSTQVMKNTQQYMELLEKNGSTAEGDDIENEEEAKERKKEIYKNLSSEEIARLKIMQIDLSTVSLSDIAGLVSAIRSEVHQQEFNQRIADICDGVDAVRGQITHDNLKDALKSLLPESMSGLVIDSVLEENYTISEQQMIYLLKNELQLTIANLYKSEYATSSGLNQSETAGVDAEAMKLLEPQIDSVIRQSGIEVENKEELVFAAEFMINHDISLTPATLRNYVAMKELNAHGMNLDVVASNILMQEAYGLPIESANVYFDQRQTAEHLMEEVAAISGETIAVADRQSMAFTIQNLVLVSDAPEAGRSSLTQAGELQQETVASFEMTDRFAHMSKTELTARRQLEEIRLSMTQSAASRLVMSDIHIDTKELSDIVKQLRELELALTRETFADYGMKYQQAEGEIYQQTMHKVEGLKYMPAAILGMSLRPEPLTVNALYEQGVRWLAGMGPGETFDAASHNADLQSEDVAFTGISTQAKDALSSYETMMTVPRADMGDAISKAFDRVDSLLEEMQVEVSEENRRAARILGYNQMEITEDSLAVIREADAKVQQMLQGMTPRAVLEMIRNGQNPLEMSVDEVNAALEENQDDAWIQDDEKYSTFLYKLEQKKDITPEERDSYIGIFRLLDKLGKGSGRDIGFVVKAGEALTLKNLLSAHRSNQAKGIDFAASDEAGVLEGVTVKGTSISDQIEQAFRQYGEPMVEQVFQEMQADTPEAYTEELYETAKELTASEEVWNYLEEQGCVISQGNLQAAAAMIAEDAGIYGMVEKWISQAEEKSGSSNQAEEMGAEMEALLSNVTEKFDSPESVKECYEAIADRLGEMSRTELTGILTHQDIQSLKQIHTGFSLLRREADRESFQVPVRADGKWMMMHVRFENQTRKPANQNIAARSADSHDVEQYGSEGAGSITFSMRHERLGGISARIVTGTQTGGEIQTEQGVLNWSQEILERAEMTRSRADQYALAKDIFKLIAGL